MSSTKSIKQRIKSTKSTAQITKAMEVVSANKMRKAQEFALRARPYAVAAFEMLGNLLDRTPQLPALLTVRPIKRIMLIVVTSDKGLAGALNTNVLRKAEQELQEKQMQGIPVTIVPVGKKAKEYFSARGGSALGGEKQKIVIEKSFQDFGDYSSLEDTLPVAELALQGFLNNSWDAVEVVYTNFRTTLLQEVAIRTVLPVTRAGITTMVAGILPERGKFAEKPTPHTLHPTHYSYEYKFEPSPEEILNELVSQLLRINVHHIILESNASEHSARMVAMKNASESATELIDTLTLVFNKARQANITRELTEITAGAEMLQN